MHKRFKITLFIRTKHNMQIFGVIPFIKLQNNIEITIKRCMVHTQHAMKQQQFHMAQVL